MLEFKDGGIYKNGAKNMQKLSKEIKTYKKLLTDLEAELTTLPQGTLVRRKRSYLHKVGDKKMGITFNIKIQRQLARKKILLVYIAELRKIIGGGDIEIVQTPSAIIATLSKSYQSLPVSYFYHTDVIKWMEVPYKKSTYKIDDLVYETDNGVKVRTKSELIIANQLEKSKIPYRYEEVTYLNQNRIIPDFIVRNPFTGQTFIWEHFGALYLKDYEIRMLEKMTYFKKCGYTPFVDVIYTFESDVKHLEFLKTIINNIILG